ncbi:hypothetical protein ABFY48_26040 [Lysinibacillus pakistanensis]|uniref:hypothetical protein n=1 Tax=Lysinibacillus pakistanensis TaxID=759811 RepID=UPI003D29BE7D
MYKKTLSVALTATLLSSTFLMFPQNYASAAENTNETNELGEFESTEFANGLGEFETEFADGVGEFESTEFADGVNFAAMAAEVQTAFYASYAKYKQIGSTFTLEETISRSELIKIKNFIVGNETNAAVALSGTAGLLAGGIPGLLGYAAGVGISIITYGLTSLLPTQGKALQELLDESTRSTFKITAVYRYQSHGSDGMYRMSKVSVY